MKKKNLLLFASLFMFLIACKDKIESINPAISNPDWTTASHQETTPNYAVAFPQDRVNTLEFTFRKTAWDSLTANLKKNYYGVEFGLGIRNLSTALNQKLSSTSTATYIGAAAPMYIDADVKFNGKSWQNVGFQYDGYLALFYSWVGGVAKMPFRLQTNKFETKYRATKNQNFYGFQHLTFSPGYDDISMIREKTGTDLFRENGIPTAQTAFYKIYVDYGEGKKYFGIYTMSEVLEDTMIKQQFGENTGNIYEPESNLKVFYKGAFTKKNNISAANYADAETLIAVLNSPRRKTNYAEWKQNFEKNFDIEPYIKWLAINNVIRGDENYDGNYHLYTLPSRKMTWIPTGFTSSFKFPATTTVNNGSIQIDLGFTKVTDDYPLIKYIIDEPSYYVKYKKYIQDFNENYFTPAKMNAMLDKNQRMIAPFVTGAEMEVKPYTHLPKPSDFDKGIEDMKAFVVKQNQQVKDFLK